MKKYCFVVYYRKITYEIESSWVECQPYSGIKHDNFIDSKKEMRYATNNDHFNCFIKKIEIPELYGDYQEKKEGDNIGKN